MKWTVGFYVGRAPAEERHHRLSVVLVHLSDLLLVAQLFPTLPLQVARHQQLKVPVVVEQRAGQEGGGRLLVQQHGLCWGTLAEFIQPPGLLFEDKIDVSLYLT